MRGLSLLALLCAAPAAAEPLVGTTLHVGDALGAEADTRVGSNLWVLAPVGGGWVLGGEVAGGLEAYTGGYRCGMSDAEVVPSIAVACIQPSLGAHLLAGVQASPTSWSSLRLEVGAGATAQWLMAGDESLGRELDPSGLVRAGYLLRVVDTPNLGAVWWLGVALEERAVGLEDTRLARSLGLILEGRSH